MSVAQTLRPEKPEEGRGVRGVDGALKLPTKSEEGEMGRYDVRPCPCGSGKPSQWRYDAKGIELCRTCDDCHERQMSHYRPEILTGYTQEDVDEPIWEDE